MGAELPDQPGGIADRPLGGLAGMGGAGQFVLLDRPEEARGGRVRHAVAAVLRCGGGCAAGGLRERGLRDGMRDRLRLADSLAGPVSIAPTVVTLDVLAAPYRHGQARRWHQEWRWHQSKRSWASG